MKKGIEKGADCDWSHLVGYSRQEAIKEQMLEDVTDIAKEGGFQVPVALSLDVVDHYKYGNCSEADGEPKSRIIHILRCLQESVATSTQVGPIHRFLIELESCKHKKPRFECELVAVCRTEADGSSVITIGLAE